MVDELNRYRIREKQAALLQKEGSGSTASADAKNLV